MTKSKVQPYKFENNQVYNLKEMRISRVQPYRNSRLKCTALLIIAKIMFNLNALEYNLNVLNVQP